MPAVTDVMFEEPEVSVPRTFTILPRASVEGTVVPPLMLRVSDALAAPATVKRFSSRTVFIFVPLEATTRNT